MGPTTLTPSLSVSGQAKRDDLNPEAQSFVSGPKRISFGARLKADVYGFFGGFGPFEAVRHKISPSFNFSYAPAVDPTDLQSRVFGSAETDATKILTIGFNQTFEAKRRAPPAAAPADGEPVVVEPVEAGAEATDSLDAQPDSAVGGAEDGPRRLEAAPIVNLLSIQTNAITYDFTRASKDDNMFLDGFQTTRLTNAISSDFLRGLTIRMAHDLFDTNEEGERTFSPFLSTLNTGFSVSNTSGIVKTVGRLFGMGGPAGVEPEPEPEPEPEDDIFSDRPEDIGVTDESSIVPGRAPVRGDTRPRGSIGGWQAQVGYSLSRSRDESRQSNQLADVSLRFRPTENWSATWRTSYDVVDGRFNDHVVRLTRELHRWQAHFDFQQTATGNWTFRFNVSLQDNQDLKFDYEQRNNDRDNRF